MGHGIAEVAAMNGFRVIIHDIKQEFLDNAISKVKWSLEKMAEKGGLRESPSTILSRVETTLDLESAARRADFVIEAVPERMEIKRDVFTKLDRNAPPHAILATNTSSLPITEISETTSRPERVVGMHFFNPPVLMPLVEVIRGKHTSEGTVKGAYELAKKLGKQPVLVNRDIPGFIVNRILARFLGTSCRLAAGGVASIEEIDAAIRYKLGMPMGAFELSDYVGIDVLYDIMAAITARGFKMEICPLFEEKYEQGKYGVKKGEGFYQHPGNRFRKPSIDKGLAENVDPVLLIAPAVNEAAYLLRDGVASRDDIDKAVKLGLNYPKGIFEYADDYGIDVVVSALNKLKGTLKSEEFTPDPMLSRIMEEGNLGRKTGKGFYEYAKAEEEKLRTIMLRVEPPIAWIILNRPEKLNAITTEMISEMSRALDELEERDDVRVVILTGAGSRAFSVGADITSFVGITPVKAAIFSRRFQELTSKIEFYTKPVIAALNGYTLGGGLEVAMACDFRMASELAELGQPEINLGLIPGAGGTQRLPRLVGKSAAKMMIYTGDRIPASEAAHMGLIDKVVPPERLSDEARELALKLAEKPPLALMAAKYAVIMGLESNIWAGLANESWLFGLLLSTDDVVEGVSAFLEKRRPKFKGK